MKRTLLIVAAAAVLVSAAQAVAAVPALMVLKVGDPAGPSTVSSLNAPFTDGNGKVGFVAALADAQRMIWWDTGPVFFSSDALPDVLTGSEGTMGVSNTGGFIYSPSVNGNDAVYTHGGALLQRGDPIPPLPGLYSSFNSRPTMVADGTAYWVGGSTPTQGSTSSTNRHLFKATDPTNPASITRVLGGGDVIEGKAISTSASNFDYWDSNNGHHIHVLDMVTGSSANNIHVYVDGAFVAQEGSPTGQGDNWSGFDSPGVNDAGNYIFTGDTDGPTTTDFFLAYNGAIEVREGDVLDGVTLASGFAVRAASLNNLEQVVHIWGLSSNEHLFFGEAGNLAASTRLLSVGDEIDIDDDLLSDYVITDFEASGAIGPGLDLADDGFIFVEVSVQPVGGGTETEAIIRIAIPEPTTLALLLAGVLVSLRRRRD